MDPPAKVQRPGGANQVQEPVLVEALETVSTSVAFDDDIWIALRIQ